MKNRKEIEIKRDFYQERLNHYKDKKQRYETHKKEGSYYDLTHRIKSYKEHVEYYQDLVNLLNWVLEEEQERI